MMSRGCALVIVLLVLALFLIQCAGPKASVYHRQAAFVEEEYAPYVHPGASTIIGQALVETEDGEVKYGAGSAVYLNPVTTYSTEWFNVGILQGKAMSKPDERVWPYHRSVTTDEKGNFEFNDLAPGEYYLATTISWQIPGEKEPATIGVNVGSKVEVGEGETASVILGR
jgi:hypothetical protein